MGRPPDRWGNREKLPLEPQLDRAPDNQHSDDDDDDVDHNDDRKYPAYSDDNDNDAG